MQYVMAINIEFISISQKGQKTPFFHCIKDLIFKDTCKTSLRTYVGYIKKLIKYEDMLKRLKNDFLY